MAEYALNVATPVAVGAAVPYNLVICPGNCNVMHRQGSGIVTVKGGSCCKPARYRVNFHANVTGVAGAIQLALYVDGEQLPETLMSVVPAATTGVWSVDAETEVCTMCDCTNISARVVTGATVTVNTADIIVDREA